MKAIKSTLPAGATTAREERQADSAVACCLESEVFTEIDRQFARFMERLSGGANPELTLAAALASRSQGQGSICVDLRSLAGTIFPDEINPGQVHLQLPGLDLWLLKLRQSAVVGQPTDFRPLILDQQGRLYLHRYWEYESSLAKAIHHRAEQEAEGVNQPRLLAGLSRLFPPTADGAETDWQKVAAGTAVRKKFCVVSGGPGTGKTRTVVALLALLLEQAEGKPLRIALAAPTGKAAARLQESLKRWKTTLPCDEAIQSSLPEESFTLHRLLGRFPNSAQFKFNARNPLPFDVVVVDEASMVDLALMAGLFDALLPSARIILLGDKDQLSSVEAGAVLGDICAGPGENLDRFQTQTLVSDPAADDKISQGPKAKRDPEALGSPKPKPAQSLPLASCIVQLQRNYRFGAEGHHGILALSQAINSGDVEQALRLLLSGQTANAGVRGMELPTARHLKTALREVVLAGWNAALQSGAPMPALLALNRFRILAATRQGPFGVENLNQLAEEILTEAGLIAPRSPWYPGRPVLVTRNDYNLKLFNGDVGIILPDPVSGELRAWFAGPDDVPRSVPPVRLPEHETVFAMTVHKSQGSEFDNVLLVLPDRESPVLTRELIYTGITRASKTVQVWFHSPEFRAALARRVERTSGLRDALWTSV